MKVNLWDCVGHEQRFVLNLSSDPWQTLKALAKSDPIVFLHKLRQIATASAPKESNKALQNEIARYFTPFNDQHDVIDIVVDINKKAIMKIPCLS